MKCFLCGSSQITAGQYITFHKFPKCSKTRTCWLEVCNLEESDNVSNIKICSKHFTEQDYSNPRGHEYGGVLKLKAGVIPSVLLPKVDSRGNLIQSTTQPEVEKVIYRYDYKLSTITENVLGNTNGSQKVPHIFVPFSEVKRAASTSQCLDIFENINSFGKIITMDMCV